MESAQEIFLRNTGMSADELKADAKWSFLLEWSALHGHAAMLKYLEEKVDAELSPEEMGKAISPQMTFFIQKSGWTADELTKAATVRFMADMVNDVLADFNAIKDGLKPELPFSENVLNNTKTKA